VVADDSRTTPCPLTPVEARLDDIFTRFEVELSQKGFVLLADNSTVEVALRRGKAKDLAFDLAVDTDSHLCSCSRRSVMGGFFTAFGRRRREGSSSLVDRENGVWVATHDALAFLFKVTDELPAVRQRQREEVFPHGGLRKANAVEFGRRSRSACFLRRSSGTARGARQQGAGQVSPSATPTRTHAYREGGSSKGMCRPRA
jgi:hypothetical protein